MANKSSLQQTIENIQLKIWGHALAEAKAKEEKAQVELETAKLQQEHIQNYILTNAGTGGVLQ